MDPAVAPGGILLCQAQHRDFVTQNEDLDILGGGAAGEQSEPAEQPKCDQIEQLEQHDR